MPKTARILQFPARAHRPALPREGAAERAERYLQAGSAGRTSEETETSLSDPDTLLALLEVLRERTDVSPSAVAEEAIAIYEFLVAHPHKVGAFDERDYFLGMAGLIAAAGSRLAGKRDEAETWLDRAESYFRHTVNSGPSLAEVGYARMTVFFDRRAYARVLEMAPGLVSSFERFGMVKEALKSRFTEAVTLKELLRTDEALERLSELHLNAELQQDSRLLGWVSVYLAELLSGKRRYAEAAKCCEAAVEAQARNYQPLVMAHLKAVVGESKRNLGQFDEAIEAYRAAVEEYLQAGVATYAAYLRVVISETLIALNRYREAEWEILAALPTIEEQKMVPEGFAAVALLKESVRRRKTDPNALRELREHLQANQ